MKLEYMLAPMLLMAFVLASSDFIIAQNSQPNILVWIDIQATVPVSGEYYLPNDFTFQQIGWLLITFAPDIEQNHLFWVLAWIKPSDAARVTNISWVEGMMLVEKGTDEVGFRHPKLEFQGANYVIKRAFDEGNKPIQLDIHVADYDDPEELKDTRTENLESLISALGGQVVRVSLFKVSVIAWVPAQAIQTIANTEYVSTIYISGPIVFR